jgi:hypothetical protein
MACRVEPNPCLVVGQVQISNSFCLSRSLSSSGGSESPSGV